MKYGKEHWRKKLIKITPRATLEEMIDSAKRPHLLTRFQVEQAAFEGMSDRDYEDLLKRFSGLIL